MPLNDCPALSPAQHFIIEQPLRQQFLDANPSNGTKPVALFIGTIRDSKGIFDALRAFSRAAPTDWLLKVVGNGTPRDEQQMRQLIESVRLTDRIDHRRNVSVDGLVGLMQSASVLLLPSRIDSGPTALKEALTMGLWPVCYDNSGPGEYIRKYAFGSLAENSNPDSLTNTLDCAFSTKPWQNGARKTN